MVERDKDPAQEPAEQDATVALIGRQVVRLALRVVELLLPRLHIYIGVGQLAEIDLWAHLSGSQRAGVEQHEAEKMGACCWIVDPLTLIWNQLLDSFKQKPGLGVDPAAL